MLRPAHALRSPSRARLIGAALRARPARAALAASGVAGSTLLVLVLLGSFRSLTLSVVAYTGQAGADLWVAPRGTDNLIRSGGMIPAEWETSLGALPGVISADPILRTFATVETLRGAARRARLTLLAIGCRGPRHDGGAGGPPAYESGRAARGPHEVALDRAAAFRLGVVPGDLVRVNDQPLRVVGLTRGTNLIGTQFLFADYDVVEDALGAFGRTSFFILRLAQGVDAEAVARRARELLPQASVVLGRDFVANNLREVSAGFLPLLLVLTVVGLGVSCMLVGLLAHGLVEQQRSAVAVLLALGAGARTVFAQLARELSTLVLAGAVGGAALAGTLGAVLDRGLPTVELTFGAMDLALVVALFAAAGTLAGLVPIANLRRIDPLEAFRP